MPGYAAGSRSPQCTAARCGSAGKILWSQPLAGSWIARSGIDGTVPGTGQAYAAAGGGVAALGVGMLAEAFSAATGEPLWAAAMTGFPAGSSIVSVRAWPQVVTVGVAVPHAAAGAQSREEVVLRAADGQRLRSYRAALYGGAVAADARHTVIIGARAVTSYDNASGRVAWTRPTGPAEQVWRTDGGYLYVTEAAGGYVRAAPVTALRRISLATGAERVVRPAHGSLAGTLSEVFEGVVVFSGQSGLTAYSGTTGRLLWRRGGVLPDPAGQDRVTRTLYVTKDGQFVVGIRPQTGTDIRHDSAPGSPGLYGIRAGVALGLDQGALGDAWGYSIARQRVIWTTPPLPWPHYFVDLSGIGGSAGPASTMVLLTACAKVGGPGPGGAADSGSGQAGQSCIRPELVAISR